MDALQQQDWPVCRRLAKFRLVDAGERKHLFCYYCTEFQISLSAETRLAKAGAGVCEQYSAMARQARDNRILVITFPFGLKNKGPSYALDHKFVSREQLPA